MVADWSEAERLAGERETLGLFLSGHPITPYEPDLKFLVSARLADVGGPKTAAPVEGARNWSGGKPATVAGLVLEIRRRPNRVTLILDDRSAPPGSQSCTRKSSSSIAISSSRTRS